MWLSFCFLTTLMILTTHRLCLRQLTEADFPALCSMLQDNEVMYAYNGAFSDAEVRDWLQRQLQRYAQHGFGLWAVILRESGCLIGQSGLTWQDWHGRQLLEIGYLFAKAYWHRGYATEAALACKHYAFHTLQATQVCSIIRDTNLPSQRVAIRCGMQRTEGVLIKHYRGAEMPHYLYRAHL